MNLLIVGAPGVGKGTASDRIVEHYHVVHISTGDILRQAIKDNSEVGRLAKDYLDKGLLVPDSIIERIIKERLSKDDVKNGFLFDGYPRTVKQAESLNSILKSINTKIDKVINLNVEDEILIKRIEGRRTCPNCGSSYNIYYKLPKTEGVCDTCGSNLIIRSDDNAESMKKRLSEFRTNTQPVIEYYKELNLVIDINGNQEYDEVFADIKKSLEGIQ